MFFTRNKHSLSVFLVPPYSLKREHPNNLGGNVYDLTTLPHLSAFHGYLFFLFFFILPTVTYHFVILQPLFSKFIQIIFFIISIFFLTKQMKFIYILHHSTSPPSKPNTHGDFFSFYPMTFLLFQHFPTK